MKVSRAPLSIPAGLAILFCVALLAQDKPPADNKTPDLEPAKRIEILTLSNQRHLAQEEIDRIQIQFLANQVNSQSNLSSTQQRMTVIQDQIEKAKKELTYDHDKFDLDPDTATLRAKPTPGNPTGPPAPTPPAGEKAKTK